MEPIEDPDRLGKYRAAASEMTGDGLEFEIDWLRRSGWRVVPTESGTRFSREDAKRIVHALGDASHLRCVAVATENLERIPTCYTVAIAEACFQRLNRALGVFRFLVTDEARSWAILCTEWYNLYAGPGALVKNMVGAPAALAFEAFRRFASALAKGDLSYPLLEMARRYEVGVARPHEEPRAHRRASDMRVKLLPDGRRAVLRRESSDGTAMLEIQPLEDWGAGIKIRYPPGGETGNPPNGPGI